MKKKIGLAILLILIIVMALFSIFKKKTESEPNPEYTHYKVEGKLGLMQGDDIITEAIYSQIHYSPDMKKPAAVCLDGLWGFINSNGELITAIEFDEVGTFEGNNISVKKDNNFGIYNESAEVIIPVEYESIVISGPNVFVVSKHGKQGVLMHTEEGIIEIIPLEYSHINPDIGKNRFLVYSGERCGLIDYNGRMIIPVEFAQITKMRDVDLFLVSKDEKFGLYNPLGQIIAELKYDYISDFESMLALMKIDEKWGMIDIHGDDIIEAKFDKLEAFDKNGFAAFDTNGITGYIKREDLFKKKDQGNKEQENSE